MMFAPKVASRIFAEIWKVLSPGGLGWPNARFREVSEGDIVTVAGLALLLVLLSLWVFACYGAQAGTAGYIHSDITKK